MGSDVIGAIVFLSVIYLGASYIWRRYRRDVASRWPIFNGTIESVNLVNRGHYSYVYVAEVSYSYNMGSGVYSGIVSVPGAWWHTLPTETLAGNRIQVRINPRQPSDSAVVSTSIPGLDAGACPALLLQDSNR